MHANLLELDDGRYENSRAHGTSPNSQAPIVVAGNARRSRGRHRVGENEV
jgi:hypothetical protein